MGTAKLIHKCSRDHVAMGCIVSQPFTRSQALSTSELIALSGLCQGMETSHESIGILMELHYRLLLD